MGWWRTLLPCCGYAAEPQSDVATFRCCCCGADAGMPHEQDDVTAPQDLEKTYVFLEDYPTEKKILNPEVPYVGELPVALYPGRAILLEGIVKPLAIRMSVNLACGTNTTSDLAFHLNPRFEQNLVVRNYRLDKRWGEEETSSARRFPFKRGQKFHMQILAAEEEFLVAFNGEHFCAFTYRIPLIRAQLLQINGDCEITSLEYTKSSIYPILDPKEELPYYKIQRTKKLSNMTNEPVDTPFTGLLGGGFPVGSAIEIVGRVKILPFMFYVNLQDGTQIWPHPIVAIHVNPRFKSGSSGGVVANAWIKGKWGHEIKTPIHQFRPGRRFTIRIKCEEDKYSVNIDGSQSMYFSHRASPNVVNSIYIHGDVVLKDLYYVRNVESESCDL